MLEVALSKFNESAELRNTEFASLKTEWDDAAQGTIDEQQERFDLNTSTMEAKSDEVIGSIESQLAQAVEIVGTIVKTTMSGNYQIVAGREYRNAWIMRGLALAAFLVMGGMIVWAVGTIDFGDNGINWTIVAIRISLGLAFLVPGIYCAKESNRHWDSEKKNRRIALELAALGPFLVKLDEPKRKEIIEKMAGEYFGRRSGIEDSNDNKWMEGFSVRGDQVKPLAEWIVKMLRGK